MIFIFRMVFVLEQFIPSPHVSLCLFTWYRVKFHFLTSHSEVSSFQIWSQLKFLFCMIIISFWYHAKWKIWTLFWNENCKLCSLGRLTHAYHFQGFDERQSRNIFVCCMRCEVWNKTPSAMNIIQPLSPDVVFIHVNEDRRGKLLVLPSCKVPHFYFTIPITAILISCFVFQKFNEYLDELTEHYDIPKVSWTKWLSPWCQFMLYLAWCEGCVFKQFDSPASCFI